MQTEIPIPADDPLASRAENEAVSVGWGNWLEWEGVGTPRIRFYRACRTAIRAYQKEKPVAIFWRWASGGEWRTVGPADMDEAYLREFIERTEKIAPIIIERLYAGLPRALTVKKLVWNEQGFAHTPFGLMYRLQEIKAGDQTVIMLSRYEGFGDTRSLFATREEAEAAAQADYDARVLSALEEAQ